MGTSQQKQEMQSTLQLLGPVLPRIEGPRTGEVASVNHSETSTVSKIFGTEGLETSPRTVSLESDKDARFFGFMLLLATLSAPITDS